MPQMMPINWLISFFFFISMLMIFSIMNYYIFINKIIKKKNNINHSLKLTNWKW